MADKETRHEITRSALAKALAQWESDAESEGWGMRTDGDRHLDAADYLIRTIRLDIGESAPEPEAD